MWSRSGRELFFESLAFASNFLRRLVNNALQRRRSSVEGGSTYVVVGETW